MRKQVTEFTQARGYKGEVVYLMVTWEWNNGWNLIATRPATERECREHKERL